jgi:hypothetical protein
MLVIYIHCCLFTMKINLINLVPSGSLTLSLFFIKSTTTSMGNGSPQFSAVQKKTVVAFHRHNW